MDLPQLGLGDHGTAGRIGDGFAGVESAGEIAGVYAGNRIIFRYVFCCDRGLGKARFGQIVIRLTAENFMAVGQTFAVTDKKKGGHCLNSPLTGYYNITTFMPPTQENPANSCGICYNKGA